MTNAAGLAPEVLAQIARLGGRAPADPAPGKDTINGRALPPATRQLLAVKWPPATYASRGDRGRQVWLVQFGMSWWVDPEEIAVADRGDRPLVAFGQTDGGNYLLALDLDDPNPADPLIYQLDHDDPDQTLAAEARLSAFLQALRPE
jgi:hypothetical protein